MNMETIGLIEMKAKMKKNKLNYISRNDRSIEKGQLVAVHYNSHKSCFSVVSVSSRHSIGNVLGYVDNIVLSDCTTHIDKAKQRSVRNTGVKDRHAFIVGKIVSTKCKDDNTMLDIYYNPYKLDNFVDKQSMRYLDSMSLVSLCNGIKPIVKYYK